MKSNFVARICLMASLVFLFSQFTAASVSGKSPKDSPALEIRNVSRRETAFSAHFQVENSGGGSVIVDDFPDCPGNTSNGGLTVSPLDGQVEIVNQSGVTIEVLDQESTLWTIADGNSRFFPASVNDQFVAYGSGGCWVDIQVVSP